MTCSPEPSWGGATRLMSEPGSFHKLTPLRVRQLLWGRLGEGVSRRPNPSRTVPRSWHDTGRLVAGPPSAVRVPGRLFFLGLKKQSKPQKSEVYEAITEQQRPT